MASTPLRFPPELIIPILSDITSTFNLPAQVRAHQNELARLARVGPQWREPVQDALWQDVVFIIGRTAAPKARSKLWNRVKRLHIQFDPSAPVDSDKVIKVLRNCTGGLKELLFGPHPSGSLRADVFAVPTLRSLERLEMGRVNIIGIYPNATIPFALTHLTITDLDTFIPILRLIFQASSRSPLPTLKHLTLNFSTSGTPMSLIRLLSGRDSPQAPITSLTHMNFNFSPKTELFFIVLIISPYKSLTHINISAHLDKVQGERPQLSMVLGVLPKTLRNLKLKFECREPFPTSIPHLEMTFMELEELEEVEVDVEWHAGARWTGEELRLFESVKDDLTSRGVKVTYSEEMVTVL